MKVTGLKEELLDEFFIYGKLPDKPSLKCYLNCYSLKLGIYNYDGQVDVKKWIQTFDYIDLPLAQKCANIEEPDLCRKVYLMVQCVYDNVSKRFSS